VAGTEQFIFGVDLDGVCGDYTSAFREVTAELLGVPVERLPLERSWDFQEWGFVEGDYERIHRVAVLERRILRDLPVIEGAADALWRLSDAGIWIRIITHRLYVHWSHAAAITDTVEWLDQARIPYRDLCFLGAKPEVEADAYIDDGPHNVVALREHGNDVIVFDQPYNRHLDGPRAHNWAEAEELVYELVARKGAGVQQQLPGVDAGADRLERNTALPGE
jgi:5'(3')-deoxyribonucleotidase